MTASAIFLRSSALSLSVGRKSLGMAKAARPLSSTIRRLPVLNKSKRLVGMVSLGDLAKSGQEKKVAEEVLEDVSRSEPQR